MVEIDKRRIRALKDYSGIRFGRLVAVALNERDLSGENNHAWLFKCDCGTNKVAKLKNVRSGKTLSCGCLAKEVLIERNTKHGLSHLKEYICWKEIKARCLNRNNGAYHDYGGRGVAICERWKESFSNFFEDMGKKPDESYSIDRIDNNGNYEPSNCRWATKQEQENNKRTSRLIEYNGEIKTLEAWCKQYKLEHSRVSYRLGKGYTLDEAFSDKDFRK